jgi:hypothetical protein
MLTILELAFRGVGWSTKTLVTLFFQSGTHRLLNFERGLMCIDGITKNVASQLQRPLSARLKPKEVRRNNRGGAPLERVPLYMCIPNVSILFVYHTYLYTKFQWLLRRCNKVIRFDQRSGVR